MKVRHPVQPIDQLIGHVSEGLDERDTRIGNVVIGPGGIAQLDQSLGLIDEVLETSIIEVGGGKRHGSTSVGIT